ncbi:MAG: MFS transporter [Desulfobacterales bacterium]|jgi:GPH family glycoside/pentoside/hexuronide:cation symporter
MNPAHQNQEEVNLSKFTKIVYGSGDWGLASWGTLRQIFYAIFLTDVVGLEARLASFAALLGVIWDAINDPLVGMLSDRVETRFGRRRPFLLIFAIPFGMAFLLMWWAPPWENQIALMIHISLAYIISDTLQTLVAVPFYTLTPEMTPDYDERTDLTSYRMVFNLIASLVLAVSAPMIKNAAIQSGFSPRQSYLIIAGLFGGLGAIPFLIMFFFVHEQHSQPAKKTPSIKEISRTVWDNVPFRFATGLYMLNWMTVDLVALMLPFYLTYWIAGGNLTATISVFGEPLALESVIFGLMFITAVVAIPLWNWLSQRTSKRTAYLLGMGFWAIVQILIIFIQPHQTNLILFLTFLAGISISTAHVLPEAIFPDVIEWEELRTRNRHEGVYYGTKNFLRKLTGAVAIFTALQILGWFGYQTPPQGTTSFQQNPEAVLAIRLLTGPLGAVLLFSAMVVAWFYPLTREKHNRIRKLLLRREERF